MIVFSGMGRVMGLLAFLSGIVSCPPLNEISSETVNLENFRELFASKSPIQGEVRFWQYILNSIFLASAHTVISLFFSSLGGYALAKYRFRGQRFRMQQEI